MFNRLKRRFGNFLITCLILTGLGLLLYPTISDMWNQAHQSRAIAGYTESVGNLSETDYSDLWKAAKAYNESLLSRKTRFIPTEESTEEYLSLMNVTSDGMMAYIEIPKIGVNLPIYHGTGDEVLQVAVGHLEGSSLPIGGIGTHACLSGHRGLPSAKLFSRLDELEVGDVFYIYVLNETHEYTVSQINVVLPEEMELLDIDPNQDICTLITCTPYGINTHRLLVRGIRSG